MSNISKYILTAFLAFLPGMLFAQDQCISLSLSYKLELGTGAVVNGDADVIFQDNAYILNASGLELYCDGETLWVLDSSVKEVYIEAAEQNPDLYIQNPALFIMNPEGKFTVSNKAENEKNVSFDVTPNDSDDFEKCHIQINRSSVKKTDRKDVSSFRPPYKFDSSWVVVDLR